jgi:phospholipid/cholesterol/gamma-HCH transport system ATP-binding protein
MSSSPDRVTNGEPVVTFNSVRVGFDEGDILQGVSFQVQPRETLVLLGETGTGKTLTLKLAAGLLRPSQGSVEALGQCVSAMTENDLLAYLRQVGFVIQEARCSIR